MLIPLRLFHPAGKDTPTNGASFFYIPAHGTVKCAKFDAYWESNRLFPFSGRFIMQGVHK